MSATLTGRAVRALVRLGQLEVENELLRTVTADAIKDLEKFNQFYVFFDTLIPPGRGQGARQALSEIRELSHKIQEAVNGLDAA